MVAKTNQLPQRSKSLKLSCDDLGYTTMTVTNTGKVISKEEKEKLREKYGYCLSCQGSPILCFDITKSRINPLWSSKEPRTVDGECFEGVCLHCHPEKDPRRQRFALTKLSAASSRRLNAPLNRKDIQRDLSNGSVALSQSRRDLFRSSQSKKNVIAKEPSCSSLTSTASTSSRRDQDSLFGTKVPGSPNPASDLVRASSGPSGTNTATEATPTEMQRSRSCPMKRSTAETTTVPLQRSPSSSDTSTVSQGSINDRTFEVPSARALNRASSSGSAPEPSKREPEVQVPPLQASRSLEPHEVYNATERVANLSLFKSSCTKTNVIATTSKSSEKVNDGVDAIVRNLTSLIQELASSRDFDFLIEVLTNALQSYNTEAVKIVCLEGISRMCKQDSKNKERLGQVGSVMEEIVFSLKNFNSSNRVQQNASNAIACLVSNKKARTAFVQSGACRLLVRALQNFPDDPAILNAAVSALRGLSIEPSAQESFRLIMAAKYVTQTMSQNLSHMSLQRDGCAFLSNVSVDMENQDVCTVPRELLKAIVDALRVHKTEENLVSIGCFALRNLTCDQVNLRTLRGIDGVFGLFEESEDGNDNTVLNYQDAYEVLDRLHLSQAEDESLEDQALESLQVKLAMKDGHSEAIGDILELMKDFEWSAKVVTECLQALINFSANPEAIRDAVGDGSNRKLLIACIEAHSTNHCVVATGCNLLRSLAGGSTPVKRSLHENGASKFIIESIEGNPAGECVRSALAALELILSVVEQWDEKDKVQRVVREAMEAQKECDAVQSHGQAVLGRFSDK